MIRTSKRNTYLGVHVTPEVKEAIRAEWLKRRKGLETDAALKISQSLVVNDLLADKLDQLGYETRK